MKFPIHLTLKNLLQFGLVAVIFLVGYAEAFWPWDGKYVAKVNGDIITKEDFKKKLVGVHSVKNIGEKMGTNIASVDHRKILNEMIDKRLMIQESLSIGLDKIPEFIEAYDLAGLNLSLDMLRKEEVVNKVKIADDEIRKRFINLYESVRLRHLFIKDQKKGEELLRILREGGDFKAIVEKESGDPESIRKKGGDTGFKRRGEMFKEIAEAAFRLKEGEISGLIKTVRGFHIIRVEEKKKPEGDIPRKVKKRIRRIIFKEKELVRNREYLESLRKDAEIIIDEDAMKSIQPEDKFDGGKMIIATVNGKAIMHDEILIKLKSRPKPKTGEKADVLKKSVIESLIRHKLLDIEALKKNYEKNENFQNSLEPVRNSLLLRLLSKNIIAGAVKLEIAEVKNYYEDNEEKFREPDQVKLSIVLLKRMKTAKSVMEELNEGARFETIAEDMSKDPSASKKGNIGWLSVDAAFVNLMEKIEKIGGIYGPFTVDNGFLIVRLDGRKKGKKIDFDLLKYNIAEDLRKKKFERQSKNYIDRLRSVSTIKVNESVLKEFIKPKRKSNKQKVAK